ncbi:MAG: bioD [Hydrocarboniphaga sp.]|uniref:dethiobiotin synthase n=1 Tax=Hydrocarboniphaga sp. TaxID=2033016 RepID=UPI00261123D3|nr:dethiobiotin synthase [Hydrocarboniphaga sp.]MDB5973226.1 bioD [Hydrocarboniphaga sp.]
MKTLFVTGTDTGVGKTHVGAMLLAAARRRGIRACGFKPVASGCERDACGELRNEDALALQAAAGTAEPYDAINPYAFEPPLAPHIAARQAGRIIELGRLDQALDALQSRYDWLLVEGAGGWQVPLNDEASFADWVAARGWPVLMVVAMRLGCINHALLTADAIRHRGLHLAGWVANELPPSQPALDDNIHTLEQRLDAPLLGHLLPSHADSGQGDRLLRRLETCF